MVECPLDELVNGEHACGGVDGGGNGHLVANKGQFAYYRRDVDVGFAYSTVVRVGCWSCKVMLDDCCKALWRHEMSARLICMKIVE